MRAMQAVRLGTVVSADLEQLTNMAHAERDERRRIADANRMDQQMAAEQDRISRGWGEDQFGGASNLAPT